MQGIGMNNLRFKGIGMNNLRFKGYYAVQRIDIDTRMKIRELLEGPDYYLQKGDCDKYCYKVLVDSNSETMVYRVPNKHDEDILKDLEAIKVNVKKGNIKTDKVEMGKVLWQTDEEWNP